jgi:hypothetical protein
MLPSANTMPLYGLLRCLTTIKAAACLAHVAPLDPKVVGQAAQEPLPAWRVQPAVKLHEHPHQLLWQSACGLALPQPASCGNKACGARSSSSRPGERWRVFFFIVRPVGLL